MQLSFAEVSSHGAHRVENQQRAADGKRIGPDMMHVPVLQHPGHTCAKSAVFVPPFEPLFQQQHRKHTDAAQKCAQQDINGHGVIASANNTLFTSGTLGRYSKILSSVLESRSQR